MFSSEKTITCMFSLTFFDKLTFLFRFILFRMQVEDTRIKSHTRLQLITWSLGTVNFVSCVMMVKQLNALNLLNKKYGTLYISHTRKLSRIRIILPFKRVRNVSVMIQSLNQFLKLCLKSIHLLYFYHGNMSKNMCQM